MDVLVDISEQDQSSAARPKKSEWAFQSFADKERIKGKIVNYDYLLVDIGVQL